MLLVLRYRLARTTPAQCPIYDWRETDGTAVSRFFVPSIVGGLHLVLRHLDRVLSGETCRPWHFRFKYRLQDRRGPKPPPLTPPASTPRRCNEDRLPRRRRARPWVVSAEAAAASPIGKLLQLMSDSQGNILKEGEASQKVYSEFAELCKDKSRELGFDIKIAKAEAVDLKATIEQPEREAREALGRLRLERSRAQGGD